jgi:hypothetical protein
MPTKINVMFDNFNMKKFLVTLKKKYMKKTCKTNTQKKQIKNKKIFMKVE